MFPIEDIMNVPEEDVHKLWKSCSDKFKLEYLSLEGHLLLLQLNSLLHLLRVRKLYLAQFELIALVRN
jgi:hypothetical protein